MKHSHLRKEKNCLNCGAIVPDRYCSHCGQENTDPKESFTHLIKHFFEDVTHFDSQVFATVKDLVFRPGFLTNAYNSGKRVSYLNPIRMYIFISAVFFIIAFWNSGESEKPETAAEKGQIIDTYRQHLADSLRTASHAFKSKAVADSAKNDVLESLANRIDVPKNTDTTESISASVSNAGVISFHFTENKYKNVREYDEDQKKMIDSSKNGLIGNYISHKMIQITREQGRREATVSSNISHDLPKLMFVLLPLFALYLRMFYSRKQYLYSQHAIFSLHFHSFIFLLFIVGNLVNPLIRGERAALIYLGVLLAGIFVYLTIAIRNVYRQTWLISFSKSLAVSLIYAVSLILCLSVFVAVKFVLI